MKFRNTLWITKDSLKKDLLNLGKNHRYSDSPEKLVVSLTCEINELNNLIIKVVKTFNKIKEESLDSLRLNICIKKSTTPTKK